MSNTSTKRMIEAYTESAPVPLFLSSMFRTPAENFFDGETVEIDIQRDDEEVAVAIQDLSAGYRDNSDDLYTNKQFKPPVFKESFSLNAFDMIKRMAGQNPFENPDFQANAIMKSLAGLRKVEKKILRAVELQASQVLQNGTVTLKDSAGNAVYTIDYKPKSTHFPTVTNAWSSGSSTPLTDLSNLAEEIRDNSFHDVDTVIMGVDAYENFIRHSDVRELLDNRRMEIGSIAPMQKNDNGAAFRGSIDLANYRVDIWTYNGKYVDPQSGNKARYLDTNKVIMKSSTGRLDAVYGSIPKIVETESRAVKYLPSRINSAGRNSDMTTNSWVSNDGEQLFVGVGTRPLLVPTAIDTYGCITTIV